MVSNLPINNQSFVWCVSLFCSSSNRLRRAMKPPPRRRAIHRTQGGHKNCGSWRLTVHTHRLSVRLSRRQLNPSAGFRSSEASNETLCSRQSEHRASRPVERWAPTILDKSALIEQTCHAPSWRSMGSQLHALACLHAWVARFSSSSGCVWCVRVCLCVKGCR